MRRRCPLQVVLARVPTEFPTILEKVTILWLFPVRFPSWGGSIGPTIRRAVDKSRRRQWVERQEEEPEEKREKRFKVAYLGPERKEDVRVNAR